MHVSIIQAGFFLARLGRPEVQNCIEALEQYSYAYEETKELSQMMRRDYEQTLAKGPSFHEMSNAVPRRTPPTDARHVSSSTNGNSNGVHHAHHDPMVSMSFPTSLFRSDRILFHTVFVHITTTSLCYQYHIPHCRGFATARVKCMILLSGRPVSRWIF